MDKFGNFMNALWEFALTALLIIGLLIGIAWFLFASMFGG